MKYPIQCQSVKCGTRLTFSDADAGIITCPVCNHRQLFLPIALQPRQSELLKLVQSSEATWIGYGGSRGGAKSHAARAVILLQVLQNANTRACILRRTYDLVRENHIEPLLQQYPFMRDWYRVGDKELQLPNGSVIAFRYAENSGDVDAMIGKQYRWFAVDQAEAFTERELNVMKSITRWPGAISKLLLTFNPGNIGHAFLKRIFCDRSYATTAGRAMTEPEFAEASQSSSDLAWREYPADFAFLQAFGWDNVEWARTSLKADGFKVRDYYSWNSDKRFQYFVSKTQYGRELSALPQAMRIGWLLGRMDQFAGQYFDIFSRDKHVSVCQPEPWMDRWIGIDWGFAHDASCHWCAQVKPTLTAVYREFVAKGRSPKALAQEIVDRTPEQERKFVRGIGLSHDAFSHRDERDSTAQQMAEVLTANGLPEPSMAGKDVIGTAARLYEMFRSCEVVIDPACPRVIDVIPMVTRDETQAEKPVKFEGDDPYDSLRHALQVRQPVTQMPEELNVRLAAGRIADPYQRWWYVRNNMPKPKPAHAIPHYGSQWQKEVVIGR